MPIKSQRKNTENCSGETEVCLFEIISNSWNSLSDDSDMTAEIPQMFSENGLVGKPGKATGKRHDSSASASSRHSEEFGEFQPWFLLGFI